MFNSLINITTIAKENNISLTIHLLGINRVHSILRLENRSHVEGGKREAWWEGLAAEITDRIWPGSMGTGLSN